VSAQTKTGQALAAFLQTARTPNLRRAQLAFGAAWTAECAVTVVLGVLAFRDGGATAVGLVAMARLLPGALLAPLASVVIDTHRREHVLMTVCLIRTATLAGAAVAVSGPGSPVPAYVLVAIATLVFTLFRPAHSALLPSLCTTPGELSASMVVRALQDSLSALVGPLLAAALIGPLDVSGVFAVCAGITLWAAWLTGRLHYEAPPRIVRGATSSRAREALEGLALMTRERDLRIVSALFCLQTFTRGCFTVFSVVIAIEILATGEAGVGVLTAALGAGAVLGSFAAAALLVGDAPFARWSGVAVALWGLPFAILAALSGQWAALALVAVVGVANAVLDVAGCTLLQLVVPDEVMGRFFTGLESLFALSVAAGAVTAPALIAAFGERGALVAAGLVAPTGALLAWPTLRRLDTRLASGARAMALLRRVDFLRPLPMSVLAQLAAHTSRREHEPGTLVIEEGARGDDVFVIDDGRAEVLCGDASVRFMGAGECFGEIAALRRTSRTASVRAATGLRLLRLSGVDLVAAVTGYTPSLSEADALVERRLATARTRHIAIDVRVDGNAISGEAGDGTDPPRPFQGWVGLIGALDRLLGTSAPTTDESH
jgi:Cyclic nucleotide-binding domain/Major Facilitator Superfamily